MKSNVIHVAFGKKGGKKTSPTLLAQQCYEEACKLDEDCNSYDRAEALYRRAIDLNPSNAGAISNLGNLRFKRGRPEEAKNLYLQALEMNPEIVEAHYNLGYISMTQGKPVNAIRHFRRSLALDPSLANGHFNLAMALQQTMQWSFAIVHWNKYLELEPNSAYMDVARDYIRSAEAAINRR